MFSNVKFTQLALLFIGASIFCSAVPLKNKDQSLLLSIIHFSDFHARYESKNRIFFVQRVNCLYHSQYRFVQVSPSGGLCYKQDEEQCVGGVSRVATIVDRLRQIRPNPIFLNAGDCFQGTLYYDLFKGNITAYFMNKLHPDVHVRISTNIYFYYQSRNNLYIKSCSYNRR